MARHGSGIPTSMVEGVGVRERCTLEAGLFSNPLDKAISSNVGSGSFSEGFILYAIVPGVKTMESVSSAATKALESVPEFVPPQQ